MANIDDIETSVTLDAPRKRSNINALSDFAINYNWVIQFPALKLNDALTEDDVVSLSQSQLAPFIGGANSKSFDLKQLTMLAKSIDIPLPSVTTNDVPFQAFKRDMPTRMGLSDVTITLYDDTNMSGFYYFYAWLKNVITDTGIFNLPEGNNGYAEDLIVKIFDNTGKLSGQFELLKCFPTSIDSIRLSSDQPGLMELTVKLSVFRLHFDRGSDVNNANAEKRLATQKQLTPTELRDDEKKAAANALAESGSKDKTGKIIYRTQTNIFVAPQINQNVGTNNLKDEDQYDF